MANVTASHNAGQDLFFSEGRGMVRKIFISALNVPLSITAFVGNVLIVVALQKVSSIHPPSKLLLRCLASSDLCVGLITQPLYIAYKMCQGQSKRCFYLNILFETIGCMFCAVSLLTLTAISVDRLLALLLGLRYRQVVTLRRAWAFVVSFWLFSTAVAMIRVYHFRIAIGIACMVLLLCIAISTFCYMKIYFTLRHHQTQVRENVHQGPQQNGGGIALNIAQYRKTVSSALWIQMTLLACYLPYGTVVSIDEVTVLSKSPDIAWEVAICLILLNSSLNPFLYCWKMKEVRQAVKQTIRQFCRSPS